MTRIAIYPGSFDPPTRGHEDLIRRSLALADRLIVAVAVNAAKQPLFSVEERLSMLRVMCEGEPRIAIEAFDGLLAEHARRVGAAMVVRGLLERQDGATNLVAEHLAPLSLKVRSTSRDFQ